MSKDSNDRQSPSPSAPPAAPAAAPSHPTAEGAASGRDVIMVGGPSEDGQGVSILRMRDDKLEAGELRAAQPGKPITGELVALSPRAESERLFDVEVLARGGAPARADVAGPRKGPAKVASDAYRAGWEEIFGAKPARGTGGSELN